MPASTIKRDNILSSALMLFAERGFDATTIPMIANEAQVGAGTIYRYFDNKEVLVNTLFQYYVKMFADTLAEDYPGDSSIREQFHHLFRGMTRFTNEHEHALYFIKTHNGAYFLNNTSREDFDRLLNRLKHFLDQGKEAGVIRDLPSMAMIAIIFGGFLELHQLVRSGNIEETDDLFIGVEESCWDAIRYH